MECTNSFSSTEQNPIVSNADAASTGDYSVTITVDGCVSEGATTSVIVNAVPLATATNDSPTCMGADVQLNSNTSTTGTTVTYQWSGPNSFSSTEQNPIVSNADAASTGDYSVTITVDGCVSQGATTSVIVNAVPLATATNDSPTCMGADVQLNSNTSTTGATVTYQWSGPNSFSSTEQNPIVSNADAASTGDYSVTITVDDCVSQGAMTSVIVNAVPVATATNDSPACMGADVQLNSNTSATGATVSYQWSGPNSFSSTEQNPIVSNADAASAGDYSVTITVDDCVSQGAMTSVIVNAVPLATATNDSPACMGADVQLNSNTSTTGATATYQWSGPNSFSSTEQNPIVSNADAASAGDYSVTITVNDCVSQGATTSVIVNAVPVATASNNGACIDGDLQLLGSSDIGGTTVTYNWTGPSFSSIQEDPLINNVDATNAGTYELIVTVDGCESELVSTEVTVNEPPTATLNNPAPICNTTAGGSIVNFSALITAGDAGGTWNDVGASGVDMSDLTSVNFDGITPNSYQFDYTTNSADPPCSEQVYSITLIIEDCNCPSIAILAPGPLCADAALIDLSDNAIQLTNSSGNWSMASTPIGTNPASLVDSMFDATGADAGDYTLTFTLDMPPPPGCNQSASITIVVVEPVDAGSSSDLSVCNNDATAILLSSLLADADSGGIWKLTSGTINGGVFDDLNGTFNPLGQSAGILEFTYTVTGNTPCSNATSTVEITIEDTPNAGTGQNTTACSDDVTSIDLNGLLTGADTGGIGRKPLEQLTEVFLMI
ncbi:MAG: hypothetical protein R3E32_14160 [Chitinophagales bacterium]